MIGIGNRARKDSPGASLGAGKDSLEAKDSESLERGRIHLGRLGGRIRESLQVDGHKRGTRKAVTLWRLVRGISSASNLTQRARPHRIEEDTTNRFATKTDVDTER